MPLPSKRGISKRPQAQQQHSLALPPTQNHPIRQQETESQLLRKQRVPDPLPPVSFGRNINQSRLIPISLPDYEHDNVEKDGVNDEDVIVYDSDDQAVLGQEGEADIDKFRDERLRRVHTYAQRYLAGDRLYIHCARLRGPVVNNPWKKRKGSEVTNQSKRNGYNNQQEMLSDVRKTKRRRLIDEKEEEEVMATPTQRTTSMATEAVEKAVPQKLGPRRKQAAPKKVVHEEEEDEEEEDQVGEELDTISVASGVQKQLGTNTAANSARITTTTATGKSTSRITTVVSTSKTKARSRTTTLRNSSRASTTATVTRKAVPASKRQKAELVQEEVVEKITGIIKSTLGRGGGERGGRGGLISLNPKAPIPQLSDGKEDEGEDSGASSIRKSRHKAPISVDKAKRGSTRSLSEKTKSKTSRQKAPPETMDLELQSDNTKRPPTTRIKYHRKQDQRAISEVPAEQPLEATVTSPIANFPVEYPDIPTANKSSEQPVNLPAEPITPVANLSLEEPTPPSIFYGPSSTSINSANVADRFFTVKRETSDPLAKQLNSKARKIPPAKAKPKRAGSAPAAAGKKAVQKAADGNTAIDTANGQRMRDITSAIPGEEGDRMEGVDNNQYDWIPTSSDFRYKKGTGKKAAAVGVKEFFPTGDGKSERNEESINKGKEKVTTTEQSKRRKPRVIDFAALSPFGGGKVVTKDGKAYSSPQDEGKAVVEPRADGANIVGHIQSGNNLPVAMMAPLSSSTPSGKPTPCENSDSSLDEIPSNINTQRSIDKAPEVINPRVAFVKASTQVPPAASQPPEVRGSTTLSKEVDRATQGANCSTSTTMHREAPPVSAQNTPGGDSRTSPQVEEPTFAVPPPPVTGPESQILLMNTQRQLSAARKGFRSLLGTPIAEEATPAKIPSATLSRLRKGPGFGLQRDAGKMETPVSYSRNATPPGSIVLMPETPGPILAGLNRSPPVGGEASSGAGVVPDTSPSGPTTIRHRQAPGESIVVRDDIAGEGRAEGETQRESNGNIPPSEFSPFVTFDTPTKSQFGSFIQEFSPLRYSPNRALGIIEESQSQPISQLRSESQTSMVPIRLFSGGNTPKPKDSRDSAGKSDNQQRVNPSSWLGFSQSRTSNISLFNSSPGIPAQQPAPLSSPGLPPPPTLPPPPPPPPPRSPVSTPPPVPPPNLSSSTQGQTPSTPHFRRSNSSQFAQNSQQSPGTKLVGDMLELMGGGVWDIDEELNKMKSGDTQAEANESSKPLAVTPAAGKGKLGKGLFSSEGTRRVGSGKRRF